jgi:hypothetical protein
MKILPDKDSPKGTKQEQESQKPGSIFSMAVLMKEFYACINI